MENNKKEADPINNSRPEVDLDAYEDPAGLSLRELKFGLWFIESKRYWRWAFITFLVLVAGISWSYSLYGFTYYIVRGMGEDEILVREMIATTGADHDFILTSAAQDLSFSQPLIFDAGAGRYDLVVRTQNPNASHWAEIDFSFWNGGQVLSQEKGFILPRETKFLMSLAQDFSSRPLNLTFQIDNVFWHKLDKREIKDWDEFRKFHLDIETEDIDFKPAARSGLNSGLNQLAFTIKNNSAYNYYEANLGILLFSGNSLVGVNSYTLADFLARERREVELKWPGLTGNADRVEIVPYINIMRDDIYIDFQGGVKEEREYY